MKTKDFKVGQTVYIELNGNASRGKNVAECIEEWEITSVGRKYIKACKKIEKEFCREITFEYKDNYKSFVQKTDYCIDYILYATKQEIEEKHEKYRLFWDIKERFKYDSQNNLSLKQLKAIYSILKENYKD